jgi:hypothetical protein
MNRRALQNRVLTSPQNDWVDDCQRRSFRIEEMITIRATYTKEIAP